MSGIKVGLAVLLLSLVVGAAGIARAQGVVVPVPCTDARRCPVPPCPRGIACNATPAEVVHQSSSARVTLENGVLRYEITEVLRNVGGRNAEVDYIFPLPKLSAFQDLAMSIDGEMMAGEILPADRARAIYESIVRANRDPALVEWIGHGMMRTRIFPITPGEEKTVVVRFQSVAQREGDAIRVDYYVGTRRGTPAEGGRTPVSLTFNWPDSARYGTPFSPTHSASTTRTERGRSVTFTGGGSEIAVLLPVRNSRVASISVLPHAVPNDAGFALITVSPPTIAPRVTARDVVLVLDISGSMSGAKLSQAKAAGRQLLQTLSTNDRFRIVNFATDIGYLDADFLPATRNNIARAASYLDALEALGSTNISGALDEALRSFRDNNTDRLPLVLFMTDGAPTVGETNDARITTNVADKRGRARVFTFGVGADVKAELIEQLALLGRGTAQLIGPDESIEHAVSVVASRLTSPIVTDLRLTATGVRLDRLHPSDIQDLYAGQDLTVLARYNGAGRATLAFEGVSADGPVRWTTVVDLPANEIRNPFVARLWATQRVGFLSAERRKNGANPELDEEIRVLGERYSIPTMFSSYLVVEPGMSALRVNGTSTTGANGPVGSTAAAGRGGGRGGGGGAASGVNIQLRSPASFNRVAQDESLRRAKSEADMDAAMLSGNAKRVGDRVFVLRDSIWTDLRMTDSLTVVKVKPYSAVYFDLVRALPALAPVFALGDRLVVAGSTSALQLDVSGRETLSRAEFERLIKEW